MEGVEDLLPTTPAQSGMLFEALAQPDTRVNQGLMTALLPPDLDVAKYQAAWARCISRHQSLRSHFLWEGLSAPVLVVRDEAVPTWETLDWRGTDMATGATLLQAWRGRGLALDVAPVLRLALAQVAEGYLLIWACHHALIDDWSMDLILGEVELFYQGGTLPAPMPFRTYADWLAERADDDAFWADRFAGTETATRMAFATPITAPAEHTGHVAQTFALTSAETQAITDMARELRVTLGAVLTAIWCLVVNRISDSDDVTLGLAATQRSADLQGSQTAVGNFVATLPLRSNPDAQMTLRQWIILRAGETIHEQDKAPPWLAELFEATDILTGEAPFDTILSIKETGQAGYVHHMHQEQSVQYHSSFPLAMIIRPGAAISLTALADPKRLDEAARCEILKITHAALCAAPSALDQLCHELPFTRGEPHVMQGADLPAEIALLPALIAAQDGAAPAISDANGTISYAALAQRVHAFAAQMTAFGVRAGDRVGVLLPRGADAVAGFLAAWRLGAAYVPLDPAQPAARLRDMATAGELRGTLTDAQHADILSDTLIADPSFKGGVPAHLTLATDLAYIMFTSGSTGVPKGVVISHGNLAASTAARPDWYADRPDRFMVVSPFGFDSSVAGIYWTLAQGGTLIVPTPETVQDPAALCALVSEAGVTHTLCLPSLYELMLDRAAPGALDTLRCTIVAGEACPERIAARHHQDRPGMRLVNEYGPTEGTVWCTVADLQDASGPVPIGRAIPGVTLRLKDRQGRRVPDGLPGLLHVSGPGVGQGYFNQPKATDAVFDSEADPRSYATGDLVRRRADGQLDYLGRQDDQIKIRGHRIELGEVEARLRCLPNVTSAAAIAVPQAGRLSLVAYLCGPTDMESTKLAMQGALLGAYCPSHLVLLDALPLTATGKFNRKALLAAGIPATDAQLNAPVGDIETRLASHWQTLLNLPEQPDVETDFFALGGDSLTAMRLVGEVAQTFDHPLRVSDMMRAGLTIRTMARLLKIVTSHNTLVSPSGPIPANASQKAMWLAAKMNPDKPFFNLALAARLPRRLTQNDLVLARDTLAKHHDILRCRFQLQNRILSLTEDAPAAPVSLSNLGSQTLEQALQTTVSAPFDMAHDALWRLHGWHDSNGTTVVQLVMHHTISDGWSLDIAMRDLVTVLSGSRLEPQIVGGGFADFRANEHPALPQTSAFWAHTLRGLPETTAQLPTDHPVPARAAPDGHLLHRRLTSDLSQRIKSLAAEAQTSVFVVLWAALGQTLFQLTGNPYSLVAVSHANRPSQRFSRTVGCFTKALPYPLFCTPQDCSRTLSDARTTAREIMSNDEIGPEDIDLAAGTGGPLYLSSFAQIALQYNDFDWTRGVMPDAIPVTVEPKNTSVFEVSIAWSWKDDTLECAVLARAELFEVATLDGWLDAYVGVLETVVNTALR